MDERDPYGAGEGGRTSWKGVTFIIDACDALNGAVLGVGAGAFLEEVVFAIDAWCL
ncbi:hypothetical protein ANO11243_081160 [Dothideomycetidae sp. 11243]|nr:hypothetical protein ANO11243_081160 [fungal sp. No.11243]